MPIVITSLKAVANCTVVKCLITTFLTTFAVISHTLLVTSNHYPLGHTLGK